MNLSDIPTIQNAVRQLYLSDVNDIRNLTNMAAALTSSTLNAPGTITIAPGNQIMNSDNVELSGDKSLIISNKSGVSISKKLNGTANLNVEGKVSIGSSLLIQKITTTQRDLITNLSGGLLIHNGSSNVTLPQFYNGTTWTYLNTVPFTVIVSGSIDLSNYNYPNIVCISELDTTNMGTITLPLNPLEGQTIEINNFSTNNCTVSVNEKTFFNITGTTYTLIAGHSAKFIYNSKNNNWTFIKLRTIFTPYMFTTPFIVLPNRVDSALTGFYDTGSADSKYVIFLRGATLDFTTGNDDFIAGTILGSVVLKQDYSGSSNKGNTQMKLLLVQRPEANSNYYTGNGTLANWPVVIEYDYGPIVYANQSSNYSSAVNVVCNGNTNLRRKLKKNTNYSVIFKINSTNTGGYIPKLSVTDLKLINDSVNDTNNYAVL